MSCFPKYQQGILSGALDSEPQAEGPPRDPGSSPDFLFPAVRKSARGGEGLQQLPGLIFPVQKFWGHMLNYCTGRGDSIYSMEIWKHYKSGLLGWFFLSGEPVVNIPSTVVHTHSRPTGLPRPGALLGALRVWNHLSLHQPFLMHACITQPTLQRG